MVSNIFVDEILAGSRLQDIRESSRRINEARAARRALQLPVRAPRRLPVGPSQAASEPAAGDGPGVAA